MTTELLKIKFRTTKAKLEMLRSEAIQQFEKLERESLAELMENDDGNYMSRLLKELAQLQWSAVIKLQAHIDSLTSHESED